MTVPIDRPAEPSHAPWWRGAVIYQIYPRSFADSNNDGIGDLAGITAKLDYVASLGVDAIWLSPFFTSPMKDFGYDVADYRDVDPIFGTLADFDALVARAHALGLKLVIDQVYSHSSDEHAWFRESRQDRINPRADWYVWADARPEGSPPCNWQSVFGGPAWTWDGRRGQYYLHNFLTEQPDLNVHNPKVQEALLDTARFWLDRGVDGFRLDAINFTMHDPKLTDNPPVLTPGKRTRPFDFQHHYNNQSHRDIPRFLEKLQAVVNAYPGAFTVAEVGGELAVQEMRAFTRPPHRLNTAYGFDFLYAEGMTPDVFRATFDAWPDRKGYGWPSWAFSNHDAPRVVTRWGDGRDPDAMARLCLLLLCTLRGNAFLYQGEELGLPQAHVPFERLQDPEAIANWPQTLGRDGARTPMPWAASLPHAGFSAAEPWLPVDPAHRLLAVDGQEVDAGSALQLTRRLLALRRARPALRTGSLRPLNAPAPLLAFERGAGAERLLCTFNLGDEPVVLPPRLIKGWRRIEAVGASGDPATLEPLAGFVAERAG